MSIKIRFTLLAISIMGFWVNAEAEEEPQTPNSQRRFPYPTNSAEVNNAETPMTLGFLIESLLIKGDYKDAALVSHLLIVYGKCDAYRTGYTNEIWEGGLIPKILIKCGLKVAQSNKDLEDIDQRLPLDRLLPEALGGEKKENLLRELRELEANPNTITRYLKKIGPPSYSPDYLFKFGSAKRINPPMPLDMAWAEAYGELTRDLE